MTDKPDLDSDQGKEPLRAIGGAGIFSSLFLMLYWFISLSSGGEDDRIMVWAILIFFLSCGLYIYGRERGG